MNKLLELILNTLKQIHPRVYRKQAPDDAKYPYVVFNIQDGTKTHRDDFILIVDIWDKNKGAMEVENLTDSIDELLDGANLPNDFVLPTFWRTQRLNVEDPNKKIERRQLRFNIQTYFK